MGSHPHGKCQSEGVTLIGKMSKWESAYRENVKMGSHPHGKCQSEGVTLIGKMSK